MHPGAADPGEGFSGGTGRATAAPAAKSLRSETAHRNRKDSAGADRPGAFHCYLTNRSSSIGIAGPFRTVGVRARAGRRAAGRAWTAAWL